MKVHYGIEAIPTLVNPVVTSGTFDGVHLGHTSILERLKTIAKNNNGTSVVITFWPHPRFILAKNTNDLKILSSIDEKITLLENSGIDHLIIIPFTIEFSNLSSKEFIQTILIDKLHTKKLVIGYDHRFGKNREGSFEYLSEHQKELGFEIEEIPKKDLENVGISSTIIRQFLTNGKVDEAITYLGHPYSITGKVIEGKQNGRKIGFPTANIHVAENHKLIPADGVYAVSVTVKNRMYHGMLNIGFRPTVSGNNRSIEVHIFHFNETINNEFITVHLMQFVRKEKKFKNLQELQEQLQKDKEHILEIIQNNG